VAVRSGIRAERVLSEIMLQARALGLSRDQTKQYMGIDPAGALPARIAETDAAIASLGADGPLVDRAQLDRIRTGSADGTISTADAAPAFEAFISWLQPPIDAAFTDLQSDAGRMADGADVQQALDAIQALMAMTAAEYDQVVGIENLFLKTEPPHRWSYLVVQGRTAAQLAAADLDGLTLAGLHDAWVRVNQGPDATLLRAAVDEFAALAPGTGKLELARMAEVGKAGLNSQDQLRELTYMALATAHDLAVGLEQSAATDALRWTVLAAPLIVATMVVSMRNARAISGPIRRLGDKAAAVSAGNLDVPPSGERGPRDIVATSVAFDDVVANLRLLEAKTQALAACDFDAPAMATWLPGKLGESLQQSVHLLADSIIERDELQRHLAHQATHDALTGLHNRVAAEEALISALQRCTRTGAGFAVLYIDLDDFKRANDTYGHAVGDNVLKQMAQRLRDGVRNTDFLARIGGDEFMVLTEGLSDAAGATELARHLLESVSGSVSVGALDIPIAACIGIAFAFDGDEDPDQVLAWADLAVYRAKARGRGQVEIYDHSLQLELLERAATHDALRLAIGRDELCLHYQPVLDADGALSGLEALVRWERPGFGFQPPDSFIPAAEASNLIIDLDCWVLRHAMHQLVEWHAAPGTDGRGSTPPPAQDWPVRDHNSLDAIDMSINVSGRHLLSGLLPGHLAELLRETGADPARIVLEVTETVLLDDLSAAAFELAQVRDLGVRVAIDDFGTGYTSVMQLQHLPADVLKIDRSFVSGPGSEGALEVLSMLIDLGHHLGLEVTAEGVETVGQLSELRNLGCDHLQGYLFCRPLAPDALEAWCQEPSPSSRHQST
jgi:diguanylate cyclase (GGDEF)-like protein